MYTVANKTLHLEKIQPSTYEVLKIGDPIIVDIILKIPREIIDSLPI